MNKQYKRLFVAMAIGNLTLAVLIVTVMWGVDIAHAIGLRAPDAPQNTPQTMSYQGFLADDSGNPITGQRDMVFRIYDVAEDGVALWEESHPDVEIEEGVFNVQLGSQGSVITGGLFSEAGRWIELEVESVVLTPRQQLDSVPYAFNAERLNGQTADELLSGASGPPSGAVVWFEDNITPTGYTKMNALGLDIGMWESIDVPDGVTAFYCTIWTGSGVLCTVGGAGSRYDPSTDTWTPLTTTNAPTTTSYPGFSAIWTGSDMIIWGGSASHYFNIGARYYLASDTWYSITTMNAPDGRYDHGAVWTGSEMVIWGGTTEAGITNTGSLYNPLTDSWTPITTTGAPSARYDPHLFWTGSRVIVWGGFENSWGSTFPAYNGALYDPTTDSWTAINMSGGPYGQNTVLWSGTEMLVFIEGDYHPSPTMYFYNPSTNTWRRVFRRLTALPGKPGDGQYPTDWGVVAGNLLIARDGVYDLSQDKWVALANEQIVSGQNVFWTGDSVLTFSGWPNTALRHSIDLIYPYVKD